jgi:hypothetical protein
MRPGLGLPVEWNLLRPTFAVAPGCGSGSPLRVVLRSEEEPIEEVLVSFHSICGWFRCRPDGVLPVHEGALAPKLWTPRSAGEQKERSPSEQQHESEYGDERQRPRQPTPTRGLGRTQRRRIGAGRGRRGTRRGQTDPACPWSR